MPDIGLMMLIAVVLLALTFDYINGFHDTANAIATSVSTKALSPRIAIVIAALFNFAGAMSGTQVAKTIGKDIANPALVTKEVIIAALLAAIVWNLVTWWFGIPSSSSHALIGGIVGAVAAGNGIAVLKPEGILKIVSALLVSPLLGLAMGFLFMNLLFWVVYRWSRVKVNENSRKLQILSACAMAFSHGSNDAQKTMGIITMALFSAGLLDTFEVPLWVMMAAATAMALGTAAGGWRIIRTMGSKIVRLEPINGLAADLASSTVIYGASLMGMPVSTTHVVSSSIMGVGSAKRVRAVKWNMAQQIVTAWVITIPITATVGGLTFYIIKFF
ncbi:MAG: inorganic phosphate transporter [Clostridia bacterium]|nr:inorganic phosphate transporter [Clostridia bacterium]